MVSICGSWGAFWYFFAFLSRRFRDIIETRMHLLMPDNRNPVVFRMAKLHSQHSVARDLCKTYAVMHHTRDHVAVQLMVRDTRRYPSSVRVWSLLPSIID